MTTLIIGIIILIVMMLLTLAKLYLALKNLEKQMAIAESMFLDQDQQLRKLRHRISSQEDLNRLLWNTSVRAGPHQQAAARMHGRCQCSRHDRDGTAPPGAGDSPRSRFIPAY